MSVQAAGVAAITGAGMAIAANTAVRLVPPSGPDDRLSYPLSSSAFAAGQVWFAVTQALMAYGVYALVRSEAVKKGRARSVLSVLAVAGMGLTVPGELVLIAVASEDVNSAAVSAASGVFGLGVLLANIGIIGYGVLALRQRRWPLPWRRLPLVLGSFLLFVTTPVSLVFGFGSVASYVVIATADVLFVLIGVALIRSDRPSGFHDLEQRRPKGAVTHAVARSESDREWSPATRLPAAPQTPTPSGPRAGG